MPQLAKWRFLDGRQGRNVGDQSRSFALGREHSSNGERQKNGLFIH